MWLIAVICSVQATGSPGSAQESVALSFAKISWQLPGQAPVEFDVQQND